MAKVVIADDAMFMRATVKRVLTGAGHEVVGEGENGRVAVSLYSSLQPDLVILDITMPELDGIGALGEIMSMNPAARVIMCTALGQQDKVKEALMLGARDYVVKPFTPDKLLTAVNHALVG
ncbi:MAG TPA: response regulator [Armatimonadota bacterium]|nr:response regulator [Armatimonadota bacterium]